MAVKFWQDMFELMFPLGLSRAVLTGILHVWELWSSILNLTLWR
jgi:hypothetical protein